MFPSVTRANALPVHNGGLIALAGTAIARVRYFAAECLYNIAKVSKGEVLVYFNPIFDALSKVSRAILFNTLP
jgi:vacuole morphology and inheritance protein 14